MTTNEQRDNRPFTAQEKMYAAVAAAQAEFPEIGCDSTAKIQSKKGAGSSYSYRYASLQSILKAVRPALAKHGLAVLQFFAGDRLQTAIIHSGGGMLSSEGAPMPAPSAGAIQDWGKVVTYQRRYALCALLGLAPDKDVDGAVAQPPAPPAGGVADAPPVVEVQGRIQAGFAKLGMTQQQQDALWEQHHNDPDGLLRRLLEIAKGRSAGSRVFSPDEEGREAFEDAVDATADAAVEQLRGQQ